MCDEITCRRAAPLPAERIGSRERRAFLRGMASLPLAVVLADPLLARAAGGSLEAVSLTTAGGHPAGAFLARPEKVPAPAVLLIHEWWGLNDEIKTMAADLAKAGFVALAVDLYGGKVATDPETARGHMQAVDAGVAREILQGWIGWLRGRAETTGKVGTVGWCFGGGWSLNASVAAPVDATVVYYGNVRKPAAELARLQGPVLGHFATLDQWITPEMVGVFEREMAAAGKGGPTVHWYVAEHAFANPSSGRYDEEDARLAWARTLAFFHRHLG